MSEYRYRQNDRGRWSFRDEREPDGSWHTTFVTGRDDRSPVRSTYPTGHDGRCGWCYLNATHSEDAHRAGLARGIAEQLDSLHAELRRDERHNPWRVESTRAAIASARRDLAAVER